jgi:hypothetical protein
MGPLSVVVLDVDAETSARHYLLTVSYSPGATHTFAWIGSAITLSQIRAYAGPGAGPREPDRYQGWRPPAAPPADACGPRPSHTRG